MVKKKPPLIVQKKKLHKIGGSLMIALPPEFIEAHGLKEGDFIPLLANHILKIVPMSEGIFEDFEDGEVKTEK